MMYPESKSDSLSQALFANPSSEYRGAPFWSWNGKLENGLLGREIDCLKQMGFGGFYMHPRVGLATPYLSDEFMDRVRFCTERAKQNNMKAYLYDEDKWASGFGGGFVTKDISNRQKNIRFTRVPYGQGADRAENGELIAVFDIIFDETGCLASYKIIDSGAEAKGVKYYVYLEYAADSDWYNGQAYVDTMSEKAIGKFIEITHERYKKSVGDEFGKTIPAIFTDEPQFFRKDRLPSPFDKGDLRMPYTSDFDETYEQAYGERLLPRLPELIWELPGGEISLARYRYHDHTAERFARSYSDVVGKWCDKNGIALTGHMMAEPDLECQTAYVGDCMRQYRSFGLPGIDILADKRQQTTAKQAQSASHQYGREGVLSELYGVTGWDFDFIGHKMQGDWQAALGITMRAPHLYWMSMGGDAKRDYPASIGHQSPWYKKYSYIENHFARVNTAMTRGVPGVKIGVIHPVESYWLYWGPKSQTHARADDIESRFYEITNTLLFNQLDFDYINEALLPSLYKETETGFAVGAMTYSAVVVPWCVEMRKTTLDALVSYVKRGGKVILAGEAPEYIDGVKSDAGKELLKVAEHVLWSRGEILSALEEYRTVDIKDKSGTRPGNIVYQLRNDGEDMYLFAAHFGKPFSRDDNFAEKYTLTFNGEYAVSLMDTLTGNISPLGATYENGKTAVVWNCFYADSLLIKLTPGRYEKPAESTVAVTERIKAAPYAEYKLEEPNVLLLDMPEYSIDGGEYREDFVLRIDAEVRSRFGIRRSSLQPWLKTPDETVRGKVKLRFNIDSEIEVEGAKLAFEASEYSRVYLNGTDVTRECDGYYVDEAIKTMKLPVIKTGRNELVIEVGYCERARIEAYYLLGDFGVRLAGARGTLVKLPEKLAFSDISYQGFPFYGGNITYRLKFGVSGKYDLFINKFAGAAVTANVDGENKGIIAIPPFRLPVELEGEGEHSVDVTLLGTRINTFGPLHSVIEKTRYLSPAFANTSGNEWTDEYLLRRNGILRAPELIK